jgi:hypothetical protein
MSVFKLGSIFRQFPKKMASNRYYAVQERYDMPAALVGGGGIRFGRGVDMFDPDLPVLVPAAEPVFETPLQLTAGEGGYEISSDSVKDAFAMLRTESVEEAAAVLNTHFRASYGITKLNTALNMSSQERRSSISEYVLLTHIGDTRSMSDTPFKLRHDFAPLSENLDEEDEAFLQFRRSYGTHYIETVTYGLGIAIRGRLSTKDTSKRLELSASLSTGFGMLRAGVDVDAETREALHNSNLQITCEVNCGGIEPARPLVLHGFDQIAAFLKNIAEGNVRFRLAPINLTLFSYWNLLDPKRFERCRAMLDPLQHGGVIEPPVGRYGVPAGTVIAWHPPAMAIRNADRSGEAHIVPPAGWALCDGRDGSPDLRDRFVRGTVSAAAIGTRGGTTGHTHKKSRDAVAKVAGLVKASRKAVIDIEETRDHLPPFESLVYIIKLDEKV